MPPVCKSSILIVLVAVMLGFGTSSDELSYSCSPSGVITVLNPNPSEFVNAIAQLSATQQECAIHVTYQTYTFIIYNCPISHNITFILLKSATRPEIYTGGMEYHTLRCQQIPATGVFRRVTDESWVTNYVNTSVLPSVTPSVLVDMEMQDMDSRVKRRRASVGEALCWEIAVFENYIAKPLNCTVRSAAGGESVHLVQNGCSLDTFLLAHFAYESPSLRHVLIAKLYAFRFANSNTIIIECELLGCPDRFPNPTPCDFTCPADRKKRDINMADVQNVVRGRPGNEPDLPDAITRYVRTEIDVFEPQAFPLRAGAYPLASSVLVMLWCSLAIAQ